MLATSAELVESNFKYETVEYNFTKSVNINDYYFNPELEFKFQNQASLYESQSSTLTSETRNKINKSIKSILAWADYSKKTFPYLVSSVYLEIELIYTGLKCEDEKNYFLIIILNNYNEIKKSIHEFYKNKFNNNRDKELKSFKFDKKVEKSSLFLKFIEELIKWNVQTEFIFFNLKLLSLFFDIKINFDDSNLKFDTNNGFSLKHFAMKNILNLSGFVISNVSYVIGLGIKKYAKWNYKKIAGFIPKQFNAIKDGKPETSITNGYGYSQFYNWELGLLAFSVIIVI